MENKLNKSKVAEQKPKTSEELFADSEAGKIWDEIKSREIQMFALPGQKVYDYCKPAVVEPSKLYLLTSATSVLPSLEAAIGQAFIVENLDKYIVVSRAPTFPFAKK
jgi:hypothetical protein